jgi:hypothetical protein
MKSRSHLVLVAVTVVALILVTFVASVHVQPARADRWEYCVLNVALWQVESAGPHHGQAYREVTYYSLAKPAYRVEKLYAGEPSAQGDEESRGQAFATLGSQGWELVYGVDIRGLEGHAYFKRRLQ